MFKLKVISVQKMDFVGNDGNQVIFYKAYTILSDGSIGSINSRKPLEQGQIIDCCLSASKDGKIIVKICG